MKHPVDMTNARAAVLALAEPLVKACAELTVDRVVADYTVSDATREHERQANRDSVARVNLQAAGWRSVVRERVRCYATREPFASRAAVLY